MPRSKKTEPAETPTEQPNETPPTESADEAEQIPQRGTIKSPADAERMRSKPQITETQIPDAGGKTGDHSGDPESEIESQSTEPESTDVDNETTETKRTLSQSELDAIIEARLKRERAKYADYDELKSKVDRMESANKTKAEQIAEELEMERQRSAELAAKNERLLIQHAITSEASRVGLDVDAAVRLVDLDRLESDPETGEILNASEVVQAVVERYPTLIRRNPPGTKPANPDKSQTVPAGRTDADRRREFFGGGRGSFWTGGGYNVASSGET